MNKLFFLLLPILFIAASCDPTEGTDDDGPAAVDFDRQAMLAGWIDNTIVPGHQDLAAALLAVNEAKEALRTDGTADNLDDLRSKVHTANLVFQQLDHLLIGRAEEIRMREQFNTYPTDTDRIDDDAGNTDVNLELPSSVDAQGFPALDYLLYGLDGDEALTTGPRSAGYLDYAGRVINRMILLNDEALAAWTPEARTAFVENDGNSATASIDRTVNDFIFYYEKFLRAGKVGIPAGVFSDDPLADRVEAPYSGRSNEYFAVALAASKDFFANHRLADYLDAMNVERDGELLSAQVIAQFDAARAKFDTFDRSFGEQVATDNVKLLELYNELQRNTILLKVDMLQALSINVDYVDADGD